VALAPFFQRAAVAASQVIAGFDPARFEAAVSARPVGLAIDARSCSRREGRVLADLAVRLLARLYPAISLEIADPALRAELHDLALSINPDLDIAADATIGIVVGIDTRRFDTPIFAGSDGWTARVGTTRSYAVGDSDNPFGPGVAACLAAANLFRLVFLPASKSADRHVAFSAFEGDLVRPGVRPPRLSQVHLGEGTALVGLGAIGHAVAWALARAPVEGPIDLVDHETTDLGNLQRYVLATVADVNRPKTMVLADALGSRLTTNQHPVPFATYVEQIGHQIRTAVVALDSAHDRRSVQASLPSAILNAWTQPGDLGVSAHAPFGSAGACLECLYLSDRPIANEDEIVAEALGVSDQLRVVRELLHNGGPVPLDLLELIGSRLSIDPELTSAFAGRPIRALYVEGLCGGGLVPLGAVGTPRGEVHVPLAHQSALAGVLLAAALVRSRMHGDETMTQVTRVDVRAQLGSHLRQPVAASPAGCVCRDQDFTARYRSKWAGSSTIGEAVLRC
jgi:Prokaryotic E2 family C/ThiF family